jgi:hypothetical protein
MMDSFLSFLVLFYFSCTQLGSPWETKEMSKTFYVRVPAAAVQHSGCFIIELKRQICHGNKLS